MLLASLFCFLRPIAGASARGERRPPDIGLATGASSASSDSASS
jgi:hypothetical protein